MRSLSICIFLATLASSSASWASPSAPAPGPAGGLVETFEIGANVYARALMVDTAANALWVGTSSGAMEIDLATRQLRNTYTRKDGLANEYVFALGLDSQGYKWFGTNAGGASRFKGKEWKTYFPMHGLADYWIYAFANDHRGNLWIGTWAGANQFDVKTGKFKTYVRELVNEWVYGISVDDADRIWFGTEGGVSMYDGKAWKSWTHKDGLGAPNDAGLPASANTGLGTRARHDLTTQVAGMNSYNPNYVFSILATPDKSIWAGTWGGGVGRFDGKRWTNLTTKDGLAGNIVYAIARSPDGALWFGTDNGLSRYDGKSWKTVGRAQGLLDANVYAVAVTPNGDVWAGTRKGVTRIGVEQVAR